MAWSALNCNHLISLDMKGLTDFYTALNAETQIHIVKHLTVMHIFGSVDHSLVFCSYQGCYNNNNNI